jgi:hypothetical protein
MSSIHESRRMLSAVKLGNKLLTCCVLLQLPLIFIIGVRFLQVDWAMPTKIFWLLNVVTSVLAIIGFSIIARQLRFLDEAAEAHAGDKFFFYLSFLIPILNLFAVIFAKVRAASAIRKIEDMARVPRR